MVSAFFSVGHVAFFFHLSPQVCRCYCPPFSVGHAACLHLFSRSVTAGVRPFPLAMRFYSSPPKQFTVRGSQLFLEMCPPLSLLVSSLVRWPCRSGCWAEVILFCLPLSPLVPPLLPWRVLEAGLRWSPFVSLCLPLSPMACLDAGLR